MGRKVKETPLRYCQYCGTKLERKVFAGGRLEDVAVLCKRKYCDRICMRKDRLKKEYCWNHNIPIIRIPYWEYDNLTINDLRIETTRFLCTS